MSGPIHLADYEAAAAELLPQMVYDYYAGGAHDEITLRENRDAFDRMQLRYRVLRDVSSRSLTTEVLGQELAMPVVIAPTAFHQLATEEGEVATARALGDRLIVGLNGDGSVTRLKGAGRPVNPYEDRAMVLAGLAAVGFGGATRRFGSCPCWDPPPRAARVPTTMPLT